MFIIENFLLQFMNTCVPHHVLNQDLQQLNNYCNHNYLDLQL